MKLPVLLGMLSAIIFGASVRAESLEGVYAGAELYTTPFEGMQINYLTFYLRKDGSFTDKLDAADWRTARTGRYSLQGGTLQLTFADGREGKKFLLNRNGNLESTSGMKHTLHALQQVDQVPAGYYEMRSAAYRGGLGGNVPGVFSASSKGITFDGKSRFSLDGSSMVSVGGNTGTGSVAGKFGKNQAPTGGTYQLTNGEIVLNYNNGTVSRHSFFFSPANEEDLVLLGGSFYFRERGEKDSAGTTTNNGTAASVKNDRSPPPDSTLPTASALLDKLRERYGGPAIDKITTIKETAIIAPNLQVVTLVDLARQRVRVEIRQAGKLLLIKALENNAGWQWTNGATQPLSPMEALEVRLGFYQGTLGLHKKFQAAFRTGMVTKSGEDYAITFLVEGKKIVYLVDRQFALKASAYSVTDQPMFSVYKEFIQTDGIGYPSITESSDGTTTLTSTTTSVVINPTLAEADWQKP